MKTIIRILASLNILALVLVFTVGQAKADFWAVNQNTGHESDNEVEAELNTEFEVSNHNMESILNFGVGLVNTGGNEVEENTDDGDISSGDIIAGGGFINLVNVNETTGPSPIFADLYAINDTTGAESDNEAEVEIENEVEINSCSMVMAGNSAVIEANTGDNESEENTGEGNVDTGDIGALIMTQNQANGNLVEIIDEDEDSSSILDFVAIAMNKTTGADSDNETDVDIENELEVKTFSSAGIMNGAFVGANTGDNEVEENTSDADVDTGLVVAEVALDNDVNMAYNTIDLNPNMGVIEIYNNQTGHDSDNEVEVEVENEVKIKNMSMAMIGNMVGIGLNTGDNEVEENTGNASLETGDTSANVEISNGDANNCNSNAVSIDLSALAITGSNDTTGADSDNEIEAEFENEVKIENKNMSFINNGVMVAENTGDNEVEENTGAGSVVTGDTDTSVIVDNQVNVNNNVVSYSPVVEISLLNSTTGADSDNEASAEVKNEVKIENSNMGTVANEISSVSNTGGNEVSENTGGGSVTSGSATVMFGALNMANGNSTTIGQ